ncbi:sulfotransferase family 2 domain-containing protein [Chloroflexota bacterium]
MIISHKHKFIFLKTRKTAGTSIEIALSKYCGENDIITKVTRKDEKIREELGYRGPQNFHLHCPKNTLRYWRRYQPGRKYADFYNHIPAMRVKAIIDREIWKTYIKFCIERNPWDKAVSLYYWRTRNMKPKPNLLEYLQMVDVNHLSNFEIYSINGDLAVDYVGLYENLDMEIDTIGEMLDLPNKIILPKAKGKTRKDKRDYTNIVGIEEEKIIAKVCEREIALFGYIF